jgi:GNAT superfamily N-acetyltransferase
VITIADAAREDLGSILALQKLCYREAGERYGDLTIPPLTQTLAQLREDHERMTMLKAVSGVRIIGSIRAFASDGTCHIGRVIVHPDFQNRGIGKQLMAACEDRFPPVARFELFTGCRDVKNLHFYATLGYRKFHEEPQKNLIYLEKTKNHG